MHQPDLLGFVRLVHIVAPSVLETYFDEATIYVQASLMEGVPLALLAAMSRSLPIVTTDVDGCKEAVVDGSAASWFLRGSRRRWRAPWRAAGDKERADTFGARRRAFRGAFLDGGDASPLVRSIFG